MTYVAEYIVAGASLVVVLVACVVVMNIRTRTRRYDALTRAVRVVQRDITRVPHTVAHDVLRGPYLAYLAALRDGDLDAAEVHIAATLHILNQHTTTPK